MAMAPNEAIVSATVRLSGSRPARWETAARTMTGAATRRLACATGVDQRENATTNVAR